MGGVKKAIPYIAPQKNLKESFGNPTEKSHGQYGEEHVAARLVTEMETIKKICGYQYSRDIYIGHMTL